MSVEEAAKTAASGFKAWIPWLVLPVVVALAGVGVGVSGVISHPKHHVVSIGALSSGAKTTPGYSCPAGAAIAVLDRGVRVLALERTADSTWVSVRNPRNTSQQVWVPVGMVVLDADQGPIDDLPLGAGCPTISLPPAAPVVVAPPAPATPGKPKLPAPTGDTAKPVLSGPSASNPSICYTGSGFTPTTSVVSVTATDNVAVTSVTATWSAVGGSPKALTQSGTTWKFTFNSPAVGATTPVQITLTATDAAGNSAAASTTVTVLYNAAPCTLI